MAIAFTCKACGKRYSVKDEFAGKKVKCAACGATMTLPEPGKTQPLPPATVSQQKVVKPSGSQSSSPKAAGDEYELDSTPPEVKKASPPVMAGHILKPKIDPNQIDDFELEPPAESKVEVGYFFDEETVGGEPASGGKSASGGKKQGSAPPATNAMMAPDLTIAEEEKEPPPPPEPTVPCPKCAEQIKQSSVICIHCGLNLRTGEQIEGASKKGALGKLFGGLRRDK